MQIRVPSNILYYVNNMSIVNTANYLCTLISLHNIRDKRSGS